MVAQDQSLYIGNFQARIKTNGADTKCRMWNQYDETVEHLVPGCLGIGPTEYKNRNDRGGQYMNWKIFQHCKTPYHKN